ncbi:hypothetical protein AgCh_006955 [Apium graveolens]
MAPKGIYLMEVFNILYLGHDKVKPEEQHGSIRLTSSKGVQFLYDMPENDVDFSNPSIKHLDDLVVTVKGPTCYFENLKLEFDLFSNAYTGTQSINWDFEYLQEGLEVLLEEKRIQSNDGTGEISVLLGLFDNAAVADVEIKLLDNKMAGLDVYGVIVASNSLVNESKFTSVLFARKRPGKIKLGTDCVIPLSKSRVVVPLNYMLSVDISVYVNGERYVATVGLNAKHFGDSKAQASPLLQVTVKWGAEIESIYSEYDLAFPENFGHFEL